MRRARVMIPATVIIMVLALGATACAGSSRPSAQNLRTRSVGDTGTSVPADGDVGTVPVTSQTTTSVAPEASSTSSTAAAPVTTAIGSRAPSGGGAAPTTAPTTASTAPAGGPPFTVVPGCLITSTTPTTVYTGPSLRDPHFDYRTAGVTAPATFSRSTPQPVSIWNHSGCILPWHIGGVDGDCIQLSDGHGGLFFLPHGNYGYLPPGTDGYLVAYVQFLRSAECDAKTTDIMFITIDGFGYPISLPVAP